MKRFFIFSALIAANIISAQEMQKKTVFCGVDFSLVQILGEKHSNEELVESFTKINHLFLSKPDLYNVQKYLNKKEAVDYDLDIVLRNNTRPRDFLSTNSLVNSESIHELITNYDIKTKSSIGIVIIADIWNKGKKEGSYHIVKFDVPTRNILSVEEVVSGTARGYGLHNYWGSTIYDCMVIYMYRENARQKEQEKAQKKSNKNRSK